jgi:methionyl-tRNA synthetase
MRRLASFVRPKCVNTRNFSRTLFRFDDKKENVMEIIEIDTFAKVNLVVGTIKKVDFVEKSNKLLRIEVDLGQFNNTDGSMRVILSGVRKSYATREDADRFLLEKQCMVVENLAPRKMMGQQSQGMILFAASGQQEEQQLVLVNPDSDKGHAIPNGTRVT